MNISEKFYRFAAECEFMAKLTHNPKNKTIWTHMAERWIRCAELFDRQSLAPEHDGFMKRHGKLLTIGLINPRRCKDQIERSRGAGKLGKNSC